MYLNFKPAPFLIAIIHVNSVLNNSEFYARAGPPQLQLCHMGDDRYEVSLNTIKMSVLDLSVYGFSIGEKTAIGRGLLAMTNF